MLPHPEFLKRAVCPPVREVRAHDRSVVKSVHIDATYTKVFTFLINPMNWPRWATACVESIVPEGKNWWRLETRFGWIRLRVDVQSDAGSISIRKNRSTWGACGRVVGNGGTSELLMTFYRPRRLSRCTFERHMAAIDEDLSRLKFMMEQAP